MKIKTIAAIALFASASITANATIAEAGPCGRLSRGTHCPLTQKQQSRPRGTARVNTLQNKLDRLIDSVYSSSHPNKFNIMDGLNYINKQLALWSWATDNDYRILSSYETQVNNLERVFHDWKVREAKSGRNPVGSNTAPTVGRSIYNTPGNVIDLGQ